MKTNELAAAFRVSQATIHAKARLINNALGLSVLDPRWTVSSLIERNPLTWMAELGGIIVDLRTEPRHSSSKVLGEHFADGLEAAPHSPVNIEAV